nr:MAG: hypothetical protein [Apis mellifra filamentous-like virus]
MAKMDCSVGMANLIRRFNAQQLKYAKRGALYPVLFTGQLDDFRRLQLQGPTVRVDSPLNPRIVSFSCLLMDEFDQTSMNAWIQKFHDNWLIISTIVDHARGIDLKISEDGTVPWYLDPSYRDAVLRIVLETFERDVLPANVPAAREPQVLEYIAKHANVINSFMGERLVRDTKPVPVPAPRAAKRIVR